MGATSCVAWQGFTPRQPPQCSVIVHLKGLPQINNLFGKELKYSLLYLHERTRVHKFLNSPEFFRFLCQPPERVRVQPTCF